MPDDQDNLDIVREHFVITMKALQEALSRGADQFYNEVLDSLESIAEIMQAHEQGELSIEPMERVNIIPVEDMLKIEPWERCKPLYNNINACPICSSTDIIKIYIVYEYTDGGGDQKDLLDGHRCNECGYTFRVKFHLHEDVEPNPSDNSD